MISLIPFDPSLFSGTGSKNLTIKSLASGDKQPSSYPISIYSQGIFNLTILSKIFSIASSLKGGTPHRNSNKITPTLHQSIDGRQSVDFP